MVKSYDNKAAILWLIFRGEILQIFNSTEKMSNIIGEVKQLHCGIFK